MDVSARDTLCIYWNDTIKCTAIKSLQNRRILTIKDTLKLAPIRTKLYAEIRHHDKSPPKVSYWYNIEKLSNNISFKMGDLNFDIYPIEWMEIDNEPISSFNWRGGKRDEN